MAIYSDPMNGGCACYRETCDFTCETYRNRMIPRKGTAFTTTRDEVSVGTNGEVVISRLDMQTGRVTMMPLVVVGGKVYAVIPREDA